MRAFLLAQPLARAARPGHAGALARGIARTPLPKVGVAPPAQALRRSRAPAARSPCSPRARAARAAPPLPPVPRERYTPCPDGALQDPFYVGLKRRAGQEVAPEVKAKHSESADSI